MKYPLEIYFAIEVARSLIKEGFFISEGQKGRGLEEPPLVGGACFFFCFQAEQIEPTQAYASRQDVAACAF